MSEERLQILRMVHEGKVSPEEAAKLLEAVDSGGPKVHGPKANNLRIKLTDGHKVLNFTVRASFARWMLGVAANLSGEFYGYPIDKQMLLDAIEEGAVGKLFEAQDADRRIEIWLEA